VAAALDRGAIQRVVFGPSGAPARGPLPPGTWAFAPDFVGWGAAADPATAQAKLREAGRPDGFSFSLLLSTDPLSQQIATLAREQLKQVGIELKLEPADLPTLLGRQADSTFEALNSTWPGRLDPDASLSPQFSSGAPSNPGKYANPRLDDLLRQARQATSVDDRARLYRDAQVLIVDDASSIFLHHDGIGRSWTTRLQGYRDQADGRLRLERGWLAQ
jgi:peptide/nickel transport system substrate-binding protein